MTQPCAPQIDVTGQALLTGTNQKEIEQFSLENGFLFRQFIERSNEVFWVKESSTGRIIYISPAYEVVWGRSCQSVYIDPNSMAQCIHPEDRERVETAEAIPSVEEIEYRILRPDQSIRWIRERVTAAPNGTGTYGTGTIGKCVFSAADVTELHVLMERLHISDEAARAMFDAIQESAIMIEPKGTILMANTTVNSRMGTGGDSLDGKNIFEVFPTEVVEHRKQYLDDVAVSGKPIRFFDTRLGRMIDNTVYPVFGTDGTVTRMVILGIDITDQEMAHKALSESEQLFRTLVNSMEDVVFTLGLDGRYTGVYGRWVERLGMTPEFFAGKTMRDIMGDEAATAHEAAFLVAVNGEHILYEWSSEAPTGARFYQTSLSPMTYDGKVVGVVGVERDITDHRKSEKEVKRLYEEEQRRSEELEALRATFADLVSEFELSELLKAILSRAVLLLGAFDGELALFDPLSGDLVIAARLESGKSHPAEARKTTDETLSSVDHPLSDAKTAEPGPESHYFQALRVVAETHRPVELNARSGRILGAPFLFRHECLGAIVVQMDDNDKRRVSNEVDLLTMFANQAAIAIRNARMFEQLEKLATTDTLTGVCNRHQLFRLAESEVNGARCNQKKLSIIMMDLDHFKAVNDTYGHLVGDQVLRKVGETLRRTFRNIDVIGRYGGEEFVMVLPESTIEDARSAAERVRCLIEAMSTTTDNGEVRITASLGVTELNGGNDNLEALLYHADQALYDAKRTGRNQVKIYRES
jgi:diguanylate cyclase (GGDEF)-like protein/PAS domain S-box-containing protein